MILTHRASCFAAAFAASAALTVSAQAVTFSVTELDTAADIVNLGAANFVEAKNLGDVNRLTIHGGGPAAAYTFNGLDFTPIGTDITGWTGTGTVFTFDPVDSQGNLQFDKGTDQDLKEMMNSVFFTFGTNDMTLTLTGLTPGQDYHLQMLFAERRTTFTRASQVTIDGDVSPIVAYGGAAGVPNLAPILTAVFTATGTTQDVLFEGGPVAGTTSQSVSGYVLQTVPEPASAALLGLGGMLMMIRRRKA